MRCRQIIKGYHLPVPAFNSPSHNACDKSVLCRRAFVKLGVCLSVESCSEDGDKQLNERDLLPIQVALAHSATGGIGIVFLPLKEKKEKKTTLTLLPNKRTSDFLKHNNGICAARQQSSVHRDTQHSRDRVKARLGSRRRPTRWDDKAVTRI
ncbi:hypothetical protein JTE90_020515 [Oedothorax gibbosus]|uniref:Uncharacterized protein n=1 Tax=Oedothorax gibbosus TaxID=931172 RepID=A0AAV6U036_9ARAC|nr:hypothetical protein JTE90_020515 [Oedothorax gibbosus]